MKMNEDNNTEDSARVPICFMYMPPASTEEQRAERRERLRIYLENNRIKREDNTTDII